MLEPTKVATTNREMWILQANKWVHIERKVQGKQILFFTNKKETGRLELR